MGQIKWQTDSYVAPMLGFNIRAEVHKMLVGMANREDPDKTAVCLCLFDRQLAYEILEYL